MPLMQTVNLYKTLLLAGEDDDLGRRKYSRLLLDAHTLFADQFGRDQIWRQIGDCSASCPIFSKNGFAYYVTICKRKTC
jgi:hypothetical protein